MGRRKRDSRKRSYRSSSSTRSAAALPLSFSLYSLSLLYTSRCVPGQDRPTSRIELHLLKPRALHRREGCSKQIHPKDEGTKQRNEAKKSYEGGSNLLLPLALPAAPQTPEPYSALPHKYSATHSHLKPHTSVSTQHRCMQGVRWGCMKRQVHCR